MYFDKYFCIAGTPTCGTNQFQCRSTGVCINKQLVCDGYPHCQDRSDESNCSKIKSDCFVKKKKILIKGQTCSQNQFRCATGKCIPKTWICDNGKRNSFSYNSLFIFV